MGVIAGHCLILGEAEALQQGTTLPVTQAPQAAGLSDLQLVHDFLSFDLANLWQGFQKCRNLGLANDFISGGLCQDLFQGNITALELLFELCTCLTSLGSFGEGFFTLLIGQLWKGHGVPPIQ